MSEFLGIHSKNALLHGCEAAFVECVAHGGDGNPIVVYTDPSGTRLYATEDEWLDGSRQFAQQAHAQGIVTSDSPAKDKLALFRKLFKGREDVYAHGYRRKDGGIGYAPACTNEWKPGTCPKKINPRSPCADCAHSAFTSPSDATLIAHFKGARADLKDVVGLYVLDKEGKTSVLVADFDKTGWKTEIAAYRHACEETNIEVAVERSRSGNGGHAWIFFSEPLDAALARNLGCTLITHAMTTTGKLGFKAYDRLFPAQTTVAAGGFGNLIALPFQGLAQQQETASLLTNTSRHIPTNGNFSLRSSPSRPITHDRLSNRLRMGHSARLRLQTTSLIAKNLGRHALRHHLAGMISPRPFPSQRRTCSSSKRTASLPQPPTG